MYRNAKILKEAKNHSCQLCGALDGSIVAAHSNQLRHGKGRGLKAHDVFVAYICGMCHHQIDQGFAMTRGERVAAWQIAHERSVALFRHHLDDEGILLLEDSGVHHDI